MNNKVTAKQCADALLKDDSCTNAMGIELISVEFGQSVMRMKVRDDMLNGHKTVHGGMIFILADSAFAVACNSYNMPNVAEFCTINYLNPAYMGDVLTAHATEVHQQGRNGIYDIRIFNQDELKIAEFRGKSRQIKGQLVQTD